MCVIELGCVMVSLSKETMGSLMSVISRIPLRPPERRIEGLSDRNSTAKMSCRCLLLPVTKRV